MLKNFFFLIESFKNKLFLFLILLPLMLSAQGKFLLPHNLKKEVINFKLINNLIVIDVAINGNVGSYILDTGVSSTILFKENNQDISEFKDSRKIKLNGFGEDNALEAIVSLNNYFKIGEVLGIDQKVLILLNGNINFSEKLGITIHGIIGNSFFNDHIVKIDYLHKKLILYKREFFKMPHGKKYQTFPLDFHGGKPYMNANIVQDENSRDITPVKLLIDTGGSDAIWLFEDKDNGIKVPEKSFRDFFGEGITGSLYGSKAKIRLLYFGKFNFNEPIVSFLDKKSTSIARKIKDRNGSIGGGLLRRFTIWLDYRSNQVTFKRNREYKDKFFYNMSGLEINYHGEMIFSKERLVNGYFYIGNEKKPIKLNNNKKFSHEDAFIVSNVRENSPGGLAGVLPGDILLEVNDKYGNEMEFREVFYKRENEIIKLLINRNGVHCTFEFFLRNELK